MSKKLTELQSTAISGNSITSSCWYVSALTIFYAVTIVVLIIFCILTIGGIGKSANVAVFIFLFHLFSLLVLILALMSLKKEKITNC